MTLTYRCAPGSAALATPCPAAVTVSRSGTTTVTRSVRDTDGTSATVTTRVRLDLTPPSVRVTGARSGHNHPTPRALLCYARDALSGVASCVVDAHRRGHVVRYVAMATDRAGNVTVTRGSYRIG